MAAGRPPQAGILAPCLGTRRRSPAAASRTANLPQARKAVASFREDDEVGVFLLSHRAGAAGLTLVRANHVFLLEPALDPSIEQQAVARMHRIGQQRCVGG